LAVQQNISSLIISVNLVPFEINNKINTQKIIALLSNTSYLFFLTSRKTLNPTPMKKFPFYLLMAISVTIDVFAQETRLLRQPDISDKQIVFAYANDLWIVNKAGGEAKRLTSFQGSEFSPRFSPDGNTIAFSGQYGGNTDVYIIPAIGGEPKRLTFHPGNDIVRGWTNDGKVIFTSSRESVPYGNTKMWAIGVNDGMPNALPMPRAFRGELSPDGKYFAYELVSPWDEEWRNYRGGQNRPIWVMDLKDYSIKTLPWQNSHDVQPVWIGNTIYFLSDRDLAMNVYSYNFTDGTLQQLTNYTEYDVKNLGGGGNQLVYEYGGDIYTLDPSTRQSQKVRIEVRGDFPWALSHWTDASPMLQNASLSPTGARALFEARGEIISIPAQKGDARNFTNSPGARDHDPVWSPDGKQVAWFSDASGEYSLMIADQSGIEKPREIKIPSPTFYYAPVWSPDGKYIAYTDHIQRLWMTEIFSGKTTLIDKEPFLHPERVVNPVWSHDSKWIAYAKRLSNQYHAVMAYSLDQSKALQLTDGLSDAVSPAWDKSGKYIYFLASTNFALSSGWLDLSSVERPIRRAVYIITLKKGDPSPLLPESDEEKMEEKPKEESKTEGKEKKKTEPKPATSLVIDLDGINNRILSLSFPERDYTSLQTGEEGVLFVSERIPNQNGETIHQYNLKKRKSDVFQSPVAYFRLSADGKKMIYASSGKWYIVGTDTKPATGDGEVNTNQVQIKVDPRQEWKQMFREAWRFQRDFLYVPNVHGADWNKVYKMYAPLVDHVAHRSDLTYLLDMLGGEVSIGHSFTGGGDNPPINPVKIGMLGADIEVKNGFYALKKIYNGENWNPDLRAPLSAPGIDVSEGDLILAVDGMPLNSSMNFYSAFENKANRQVTLKIGKTADLKLAKNVTVVPVENEGELRIYNWVESNRRKVDQLSNGQVAYVWLPNTAEAGFHFFNRYYFAQQDKPAVVIDERFNGGGYIADYFVDILNRKLRGYFNNPAGDRRPWTEPLTGIFGPKVMIINEMAGSGGDMLPYLFRHMNIGPLVGTKTWGGLVGIWDTPQLIDGGYMTAPRGAFYNLKGEWDVENIGIAPDIEVEMIPKEVIAGRDPQLERAVEEALTLLKKEPVKLMSEPAPPVRVLRPATLTETIKN
jgi:tricorn protease